jgi:hypothetical protein
MALELETLLGRRRAQRRFQIGGDEFLRVRIDVLKKVALDARIWNPEEPVVEPDFGRVRSCALNQ